jgi:uncharacterized membrane protein YdjX (TVP38/TMEM64 family)
MVEKKGFKAPAKRNPAGQKIGGCKERGGCRFKSMAFIPFLRKHKIAVMLGLCGFFVLLTLFFHAPLTKIFIRSYHILTDKEKIKAFITSFGWGAPFIFILFQILQVIFAPVPGEATGFIGGYLFGPAPGFLYSTIGLTVGSIINFAIGRFLGKRYIRKLIPQKQLEKFDSILKRQGVIVIFILFVFPGFPKDYLCLFLGIGALPFKVFWVLAAIGRMPGTFLLSLQGAFLYQEMYGIFIAVFGLCLVMAFFAYLFRDRLYQWLERYNGRK